jgi:hypothetical protein
MGLVNPVLSLKVKDISFASYRMIHELFARVIKIVNENIESAIVDLKKDMSKLRKTVIEDGKLIDRVAVSGRKILSKDYREMSNIGRSVYLISKVPRRYGRNKKGKYCHS